MMSKVEKLRLQVLFQAFLVAVNVYGTFVNVAKNQIEYAGFTAAVGAFCFIGAFVFLADIVREKNG